MLAALTAIFVASSAAAQTNDAGNMPDPRAAPTVMYSGTFVIRAIVNPGTPAERVISEQVDEIDYKPGVRRTKGSDRRYPIVIWTPDESKRVVLFPADRTYREDCHHEAPGSLALLGGGRFEIEHVGSDTIIGIAAEKFRFRGAGGSPVPLPMSGTVWVARGNVPLRLDGMTRLPVTQHREMQDVRFVYEATRVVIGPVDPSLFEPPPDYRRVGRSHDCGG